MPTRFNPLQLKLLVPFLVVITAMSVSVHAQQIQRCGSAFSYEQLMNSQDTAFAKRYRQLDQFTKNYIQNLKSLRDSGMSGDRSSPIIIPVVVHVVYNTPAQNIPDAQIHDQIRILNKDFRKLNVEAATIPAPFRSVASDCLIEFRLAVRDPSCMPTTGITRTSTAVTEFDYNRASPRLLPSNPVKDAAAGGHDAWPARKYLNIWVCNLVPGLAGYSSFPTFPENVDGVVIDYTVFGGTTDPFFNLGRTATHEIGHWLNLLHIWGDDWDRSHPFLIRCTGSDQVDDTPNQGKPNESCPMITVPSACGNPDGDMYMNYMDYTDDACMSMFTIGQSRRMDACLYEDEVRRAILSSDALVPVTGGISTTPDLFMQDTPDDLGAEPNSIVSWWSEDIWVRRANDGEDHQESEPTVYRPATLGPHHVFVRVRNRACAGAPMSGTVKLYWTKASAGLSWPSAWDGSITTPALMGGRVGPDRPVTVPPGGHQIVEFPWFPANPADYLPFTGHSAEPGHYCLLARIETSSVFPYGMTFPEVTGDHEALRENVRKNNNIVWKNVTVGTEGTGRSTVSTLIAGNYGKQMLTSRFYFKTPENKRQQHLLQYGNIIIRLGNELYNKWKQGGRRSSGITELSDSSLLIRSKDAWIDSLKFNPDEKYGMKVNFQFAKKIPFGDARRLEFIIEQAGYDSSGIERKIGGETYHIKSLDRSQGEGAAPLKVKIKALLQGPFQQANGLMTDSLRTKNLLPTITPYHALRFTPVNNPVLEVVHPEVLQVSGPQAITDWVWIELRDSINNRNVISTRSALIRRDGSITDLDGISPVSFHNVPDGRYYIALRHRNHLGIMTGGTIRMDADDTSSVDFTQLNTYTYGSNAQRNIGNVRAMWAGNANGDGQIKYNGASNDKVFILLRVGLTTPNNRLAIYDAADTNLDGSVRYNGANNDRNVVLGNVGITTSNNIITQQLPQ